jgi:tetratricopeptide (TPR) repeat protein
VRFSIAGDAGNCYKVVARGTAGEVSGYLLREDLAGLEGFERARNLGADGAVLQLIRAEVDRLRDTAGLPPATPRARGAASPGFSAHEALRLIETGQPRQALELLGPALERGATSPNLLSLAGLAAYQSDQPARAVEFWERSLAAQPNPSIHTLFRRAQRELAHDQSRQALHGRAFLLRYSPADLDEPGARRVLAMLDGAYARVAASLGCAGDEPVAAILQSRSGYDATTDSAGWSAGQFDGRIRVAVPPGGALNPQIERTLAHEVVHACLAQLGRWPLWFHEGMAQKHSGKALERGELNALRTRIRAQQMPALDNLTQTFARMSEEHARAAYAMSLAAVEALYETRGEEYVRNLLRNPELLAPVSLDLTRRLLGY